MSRYKIPKTICIAAVLSLGLAACGGGSGSGSGSGDTSMHPDPTPQDVCESADGRWNADATCTSAAELAVERQHMDDQRAEANEAIDDANADVAGLSATSTDGEVAAAKHAIQTAKDAVTAATALSMADRDALNARISNIEMSLASTETDIANHRQMVADDAQRDGVSTAIDMAMTTVGDLNAMSTDEEVNAAKALIEAANTALSEATSLLTAEQALALRARISTIEMSLASTETAIAMQRQMDADDAEDKRMADVAAARANAMLSYMDADADAIKADAAATMAEEAAAGTPGAIAAREAATAARMAATAAMAAHDAIMDDMTKAEADAQAEMAATQAGTANSQYAEAKSQNNAIQTAKATAEEQNRIRDIEDATSEASDAAMAARASATAARTNATSARRAATAANAAYARAAAARTDSSTAKTQAHAAAAAATAAEMAATAAEMAADLAEAAHMGIDPDGSAEDAETAQTTAETAEGTAETNAGTASTQYMAAKTASDEAATAASAHVLTLFLAANGAHVMDTEGTPANDTAAHVRSVGAAMAAIAAATDGNQAAATTVTAIWLGDTVDNPTSNADESAEGMFSITVNVNGDASIVSELRASRDAVDLNDNGNTNDPGEAAIIQTAKPIANLGVFRGYDLWEDDGMANTGNFGDRARVVVFTDKQKGDDSVLDVTAATARSVVGHAVTATDLSGVTSTATTIRGVTWTPGGQTALMGTLSCTEGCSITLGENGAVTEIAGYTFTGSRAAREAVTAAAAMEDNDFLAFGLWLQESDDGATDTFGAFASGGTEADVQDAITGTARYSGKAAGAHHKTGEGVNWFHGDANLTANFGADNALGTISGAISNIRVNGGPAMSDSIYLGQADLRTGDAGFDGAAFMGEATAPGADTHEFDGTWSGSFFGPSAAVVDDPDTTEDEAVAAGALAPAAVAGTFGVTKSEVTGTGADAMTTVESFVGAFGARK